MSSPLTTKVTIVLAKSAGIFFALMISTRSAANIGTIEAFTVKEVGSASSVSTETAPAIASTVTPEASVNAPAIVPVPVKVPASI